MHCLILSVKPPIVYEIYKLLLINGNNGKKNWVSNVTDLLCNLGFNDLWISQYPSNFSLEVTKLLLKTNIYSYVSQDLKNVINLIFIRELN